MYVFREFTAFEKILILELNAPSSMFITSCSLDYPQSLHLTGLTLINASSWPGLLEILNMSRTSLEENTMENLSRSESIQHEALRNRHGLGYRTLIK